jgi:energy-converting hydrogenase Eha subunit H
MREYNKNIIFYKLYRMKYIVCCHPIFGENALCLSKKLDIPIITKLEPIAGDVYIIFGAHMLSDELVGVTTTGQSWIHHSK